MFQVFPPKTLADQVRSLILFIVILAYVGIGYFVEWSLKKEKTYAGQVNKNREDIEAIKEKMKTEKRFQEAEKRISVIY